MNLQKTDGHLTRIFNRAADAVLTTVHLDAGADAIWDALLSCEDVLYREGSLLRLFLHEGLRSEDDEARSGPVISCASKSGQLVKCITAGALGQCVRFDVLVQELGNDESMSLNDGSCVRRTWRGGSEVVLTTRIRGSLRPRWLVGRVERVLVHRMHDRLLRGMRELLAARAATEASRGANRARTVVRPAESWVKPSLAPVKLVSSWPPEGCPTAVERRRFRQFPVRLA